MNDFLINGINEFITVKGKEVEIVTSFRLWLKYFKVLEEKNLTEIEKTLLLIVPNHKIDDETVLKLKEWALPIDGNVEDETKSALSKTQEEFFNIFMDEMLIIADFQREYNINLLDKDFDISWVRFKILLDNLSNKSAVSSRMSLRQISLKDVDKKSRMNVRRLKEKYKIIRKEENKITLEQRNEMWKKYVKGGK